MRHTRNARDDGARISTRRPASDRTAKRQSRRAWLQEEW